MRVLVFLSSAEIGGTERMTIILSNRLSFLGHNVCLVLGRKGPLFREIADGVEVIDLQCRRVREMVIPLSRLIRDRRPDVICATKPDAAIGAMFAWLFTGSRSRLVVRESNHRTAQGFPKRGIFSWLLRWTYRQADQVIAPSQAVADDLIAPLIGKEVWIVSVHGDFAPENCLLDARSKTLRGVVDWEHFESEGLSLFDLINFLLRAHRVHTIEQHRSRGEQSTAVKFHGYPEMFSEGPAHDWLLRYFRLFDMDIKLMEPFVFLWWVKKLQLWASLRLYDPNWRRLRVFPIIQRWDSVEADS